MDAMEALNATYAAVDGSRALQWLQTRAEYVLAHTGPVGIPREDTGCICVGLSLSTESDSDAHVREHCPVHGSTTTD